MLIKGYRKMKSGIIHITYMTVIVFLLMWVYACGWPWQGEVSILKKEPYEELISKNLEIKQKMELLTDEADGFEKANRTLINHIKELIKENESLRKAFDLLRTDLVEEKLRLHRTRTSKEALAVELGRVKERLIKLEELRKQDIKPLMEDMERRLKLKYERQLEDQNKGVGKP